MVIYVKSVLQLQLTFLQFELSKISFPYSEEEPHKLCTFWKVCSYFLQVCSFFLFINFL